MGAGSAANPAPGADAPPKKDCSTQEDNLVAAKSSPSVSQLEDALSECRDVQTAGHFVVPAINAFGGAFRVYDAESVRRATVEEFYRVNHINQTFDSDCNGGETGSLAVTGGIEQGNQRSVFPVSVQVLKMREKHCRFDKAVMGIWECCELLNEYIDESDPDLDEPQIEHLLQTAEAIRRDYPNEDWFHLTGLIHDLGKVLLHPSFGEEPQWAVVGDTFPLGCAFDKSIVHSEFFQDNVDRKNPKYSTRLGIYEEGCGLGNVVMSWGHDEYLYQVMKKNRSTLPPQALFIIRYHSFYALHRAGAYTHLMNSADHSMLPWLHRFNRYDLYSKSKTRINVDEVKSYYLGLIEKYFPRALCW